MSIVKDKLQQKNAEFIGIRELLELLCNQDEGCALQEAAKYLLGALEKPGAPKIWMQSLSHGLIRTVTGGKDLLSEIARKESIPMAFDSVPHSIGFFRAEIFQFLARDSIHLSQTVTPFSQANLAPTWAHARRGIKRLSLSEAANVLIGVDPLEREWRGDDEWREFEGAKRVIQEAVDDGEIASVDIDFERDGEQIFSVSDLRIWAVSMGYEWPIPEPPVRVGSVSALNGAAPTVNDEIFKRLQDSERERNELFAEVAKLKAGAAHVAAQAAVLADNAEQIGRLEAENSKAQTEIQRLQTEIAQGKSLAALQKLVIGMAIGGYGYRPSDAKSPVPKEIANDLAGHGVNITDDTVRKYLKLAAVTHLPSQ